MATTCGHCGASIANRSARFCEFCGHELDARPGERPTTPNEMRRAQFEELRRHPEFQEAMVTPLKAPPTVVRERALPFFFVAMVALGVVVSMREELERSDRPVLWLVPVVGFFAVVFGVRLTRKRKGDADVRVAEHRPAVLTNKRARRGAKSGRLYDYATFEFEDGSRREFYVDPRSAGLLSVGDSGVATTEGNALRRFKRLAG